MLNKETALQLMRECADSLLRSDMIEQPIDLTPSALLYGEGANLDSIGFVTFVTGVEERLNEKLGGDLVIALLDIDDQRGTPLTILRNAVRFPTDVLRRAGVAPVVRDPYAVQAFPDDVYGLTPATWADIHEDLADPGLRWSVAKAFEHRRRHRA